MSNYRNDPEFDPNQIDSYPIRVHPESDERARGPVSVSGDYVERSSRLFGEEGPELEVDGLNREQFFRLNFIAIQRIIAGVNERFGLENTLRLSEMEVLAVCNAEMGLRADGTVDPRHDHQAGECGLLPLSTIHKAVTGNDAPDPYGLYQPEINFEEFLLYLGGLKVFGPYRPIYAYPGITESVRRQAHTAAAVVHGYFYSPNYRPKSTKPANGNILSVVASDHDLGNYMKTTTYRAAWAIPARMENLEAGMELAERLLGGRDDRGESNSMRVLSEAEPDQLDLPPREALGPVRPGTLGAEEVVLGGDESIPGLFPGEVEPPVIWRSLGVSANDRASFGDLCRRFIDGDLSEEEMAEFFVEGSPRGDRFGPNLQLDPERVELPEVTRGTQGVLLLASSICNRRRRVFYHRKLKENPSAIRILAEGDSWFQYPLKLKDIIDHLIEEPDIAVRCYSAAGDVLSHMVESPEFLDAIRYENPDYFLLSGGGNDLIAGEGLRRLLHSYDPEKAPRDYFNEAYFDYLEQIEFLYREVIGLIHGESPRVKVICHGYDYAIPNDGTWLGNPMNELGIENRDLQFRIMSAVVDDINGVIDRVAGDSGSGEVRALDLRGIIPEDGWYDEFHPTSEHYASLAARYREVIG